MTEPSILKKSVRKSSLVRRVLWGMTFLLVLPLFIHTFFLYFREYERDVQTVGLFLEIVVQEEAEFLETVVEEKTNLLENLSQDLEHIVQFHVEKIAAGPESVFTRVDEATQTLWVGKNISSSEAIGAPIDLKEWVVKSRYLSAYEFPVSIGILDSNQRLISGETLAQQKAISAEREVGETGLIFQFSVPLQAVRRSEISYYAFSLFTLVILIGLLGGGGAAFFAKRMSKPFENLCKTMDRVSEGAVHARYPLDKMGFEINALGEQFNQTLDELLKKREEAEKERIHRERLAHELKIGHEIQRSMLPASLPTFSGIDLAAGYLAAQEVSGDFYDLFPIGKDRFLCVVADSAGKGISACLYSLGFRSALRAFADASSDLSDIIEKTNDLFLLDTADSGFFVTAWVGLYDANSQTLHYCSQGHPPALLLRDGKVQELSTDGLAFGVAPFTQNKHAKIKIQPNDFLLLYTDGVLEAQNPEKEFFGKKRLDDFFVTSGAKNASFCIEDLLKRIQTFARNCPQYDDITLLAMKFFVE